MTRETAFLALVFSGVLFLLASIMLTRLHWRPDIRPYGRQTRLLDLALHPERYVENAPLRAIRALTVIGALLVVGAAVVVICEILHTVRSSRAARGGTTAEQTEAYSVPRLSSWE